MCLQRAVEVRGAQRYLKYYDALRGNQWGHFSFLIDYWKHSLVLGRNVPWDWPSGVYLERVVQERLQFSEEGETTEEKKRKDGERGKKVRNYGLFHH